MAPSSWATAEQDAFLRSQLPEFLAARKNKTFHRYWPKLDQLWFERWPERDTALPDLPVSITTENMDDEAKKILADAITKRKNVSPAFVKLYWTECLISTSENSKLATKPYNRRPR
jgi:hypothetical protein